MATNYKFEGWLGLDKSSSEGNMEWGKFEPKFWEESGVDIKVTHSGICSSETPYPICVGHDIVGRAVRVGSKAEGNIKVGDRVGPCSDGLEAYCTKGAVHTFGGFHYDGGKSMGGHATYHRAPSHFVFKVPGSLNSGGISIYSPLRFHGSPGKRVSVIGVGGLGHFAILFAKAMGADKVGISRSRTDEYIAAGEDSGWAENHLRSLDIVICTVSSNKAPFREYLGLLGLDGVFIQMGLPDFEAAQCIPTTFCGYSPSSIREMGRLSS
ncbi:GroES-like protein [Corynespora cassiicola Philippines]|uniref:GroES-like protein n=1 Tax=Corynespora cassiicola Philippines TaxID=1448308 RepID=A0A2T2P313_CORCC|nr:GroES-like protein [Corynespora cassiicola Philippines]